MRSVAETLTTAMLALLVPGTGQPDDDPLREDLYSWAYRDRAPHPKHVAVALDWIARHSRPVSDLADADLMLDVLHVLASKLDGTRAAANTIARKRAVLSTVQDYGIGRGLETNPIPAAARMWNQPKTTEDAVDPRIVVNRRQAEALLTAVSYQGRVGPKLMAFCLPLLRHPDQGAAMSDPSNAARRHPRVSARRAQRAELVRRWRALTDP